MDVFLNNFYFIWFNSYLALIPVLFGWLMSKAHSTFAKVWTGFIWLLFLPNTIYILTDIAYLFEDWPKVNNLFRAILITQYSFFALFGIIAFVIAIYFFHILLDGKFRKKIKPETFLAILTLNFIVGFGVVLGGIERTNSWYVFTNPIRVVNDILDVLSSKEMLMLSVGVGLLANTIYFIMVETVKTWDKQFFKK